MTKHELMTDAKSPELDHPIHPVIADRWSPYVFDDRPVPPEDLRSIFEAARWAPSSYNEQPWRYIVATRDEPEEFKRLVSCLVEGNQAWAKLAPVLALGVYYTEFSHNQKPNRVAFHDLGLASAHLTFEATARGVSVHQMGGILPDRARDLYAIPEDFEVGTALALGYRGRTEEKETLAERDQKARRRKPLSEILFTGKWDKPARVVE